MKNGNINKLFEEAMNMNITERAILVEKLLASLDNLDDANVEILWQKEIQSRLKDIKDKSVTMIPWEDVKRKLKGKSSNES